ncbi:MAG: hypothetical protein KDB82_08360 [Planctomycetes bacterium]|nr:hypothetical protein [Planctomycetota bacterium]
MPPTMSSPRPFNGGDSHGPAPIWPAVPSPYNYPIPPKPKSYWWTLLIAVPVGLYLLYGAALYVWSFLFITQGGFQ